MIIKDKLTEEDMDFLTEMMNIAAGNAAMALSQVLRCEVDVKQPEVFILPVAKVSSIFKGPSAPALCVKTEMVGDVRGAMLFVVPDEQKENLLKLLKQSLPAALREKLPIDSTAIAEMANIVAGVFLSAIHDFSKLNIFHTIPLPTINVLQSLIDEAIKAQSSKVEEVLVIENEFIIKVKKVKTVLFVIPIVESIETLFGSINVARKGYGMT